MAAPANVEQGEEEEEVLVKKAGATSVIWTWFGFKELDTEQEKYYLQNKRHNPKQQ